jgi:5'-3' exonuclease
VAKAGVTLLIDGDLILYRSSAVVEKEVRWDDENHVLWANEEEAWVAVKYELDKLFTRFDTKQHVIALTQGPNFRLTVDPTYKSNRAKTRKPVCYAAVRNRLQAEYRTTFLAGLEADDVMGIFATRDPSAIICSMDKDMKTIPCTLWNGKDLVKVSEAEADYFHLFQTLTGDTTDGYSGCPGIGPVKAEKVLNCDVNGNWLESAWAAVTTAFVKAGLTEGDALRQARLARILRDSDWDAKKKEPILWTPA